MAFNIEKEIRSINEKLSSINVLLRKENAKQTWVKAIVIQKLTGWDKEWMRIGRENKLVETRKKGNIVEYLLESLNPIFINASDKVTCESEHPTKCFSNVLVNFQN